MNKFARVASVATPLALASQVHAAVPAGVMAAVTEAGADGVTIIGGLAIAGAAVYLIAKVLGKFGLKL